MSEWELLIRVDGPKWYVVEAMPAGFHWTHAERTAPYWRLVSVPLLPIEVEWLKAEQPRAIYEDSSRVRTLNPLVLPPLSRDGVTAVARDRFLAAVQ